MSTLIELIRIWFGIPFRLDPKKDTILGYQKIINPRKLNRYREAVIKGDKFPAIEVCPMGNRKYSLTLASDWDGNIYGGHHRAMAHVLEGAGLRVISAKWHRPVGTYEINEFSIEQILRDSEMHYGYR